MSRTPSRRHRLHALLVLAVLILPLLKTPVSRGDGPADAYLAFIRNQAATRHKGDQAPVTLAEWQQQREVLRGNLLRVWGGFPADPCPLEPKILGTLQRDGYRVEKVVLQTRPGVWMTANAYVPDRPGKHPAIVAVHGHWHGAKQDPVVQARCIGAAKLGFFVLVVDAFGAGERGIGKALGEYHGEMVGATLLPVGLPLSGLQVYENMRAVDYLRSRPEVDGEHIGITGASGGGNQTMYAGAWDERLKAAVPVCSVGNYQAYLGIGCCICELVPGALQFTEEWGVLGRVAPRGLLIVNATRDGIQFSVAEAKKSLAKVEPVFELYGRPANVRQAIFESPHDYNRAMREAMYGWMTLHLKGEGDGTPIAEGEIKTEDPESLRCYPGETRPDDWVTIPRFAAAEARKVLAARPMPKDAAEWRKASEPLRKALVETAFGGFPASAPIAPRVESTGDGRARLVHFEPELGIALTARVEPGKETGAPLLIVLDLEGAETAAAGGLAAEARRAGWGLATLDLRATGKLAWPSNRVGRAPDHHSAEWGMWIGRPLLGQWTFDVRRLLDALEADSRPLPRQVVVVGQGPAGIVALCAGAVDSRVTKVAAIGTLGSFVTDEPYIGQRLGVLAPGILREVGDIGHLVALNAPKRVVVAGSVGANGKPLDSESVRALYRDASRAWDPSDEGRALSVLTVDDAREIMRTLQ